jgi:hypothetical protein
MINNRKPFILSAFAEDHGLARGAPLTLFSAFNQAYTKEILL